MTFKQMAIEVLKLVERPLGAKEIWIIAEDAKLLSKVKSKGKTPFSTFTYMLYTDNKRKKQTFEIHQDCDHKKFSLIKSKEN